MKVTKCRCCNSSDLFRYLDLGDQPLANSYHDGKELSYFPLQVDLCQQCFHSQLSIVIEPHLMFDDYLYVSGTTKTFQNHCKALAEDAVEFSGLNFPRVLDVACNDGTQMEFFRDCGCDIYGVDPAKNLRAITQEKNLPVEVAYWGSGETLSLGQFDIITGTNVFAHVHNVQGFLDECIVALEPNGTIILEFPYCNEMIERCEFDTIYHEHLSYFLVNSFLKLVSDKGLKIVRVLQTPIHGGSIRFFLKTEGRHCSEVVDLIEKERSEGLFDVQTYVNFAERVDNNKTNLLALSHSSERKIVGYGASAKGNTMLNYFGLDLSYIVDDNPLKHNLMTPGRNIPIVNPSHLEDEEDCYILVLSWNFFYEIRERVTKMCGNRHRFITYVPKVRIWQF